MSCRVLKYSGVALAIAALIGCASVGNGSNKEKEVVADQQEISEVLKRIDQSMEQAVKAQNELAMTADAKVAREAALRLRLLSDVVSYDFYGDVEGIVKDIAIKYGYDFQVYGKRPPEGVNVNVFVSKKPVIEVLKQIGHQTAWFDIKLTKTAIEIYYKPQAER